MHNNRSGTFNLIGADVYIDGKFKKTDLFVKDGCIYITKEKHDADCFYFHNEIIIPGIIDCHVHMRDFNQCHKEDWKTGSIAAASGGITTVIDMPNNDPPILTRERMWNKYDIAYKNSVVNYDVHFGSSEDNLDEIKLLQTARSVKVYMNDTTGDLKITSKSLLEDIFNSYPLITVHAEGEKVQEAVELIKKTPNKLYLCHISSKEEIKYLESNKIKDKIFIEVTPHHLFLNKLHENNFVKMKPGLKNNDDIEALWWGIENGIVDTIASDHAPHTIEEKESDNSPYGVPGLETILPLMLNAYNEGKISLAKIVELTSENPAKIFGFKNKGYIRDGFGADLVICDLKREKEVCRKSIKSKSGWSPFEGWRLVGWPEKTIVGGNVIL